MMGLIQNGDTGVNHTGDTGVSYPARRGLVGEWGASPPCKVRNIDKLMFESNPNKQGLVRMGFTP